MKKVVCTTALICTLLVMPMTVLGQKGKRRSQPKRGSLTESFNNAARRPSSSKGGFNRAAGGSKRKGGSSGEKSGVAGKSNKPRGPRFESPQNRKPKPPAGPRP